MLSIVHFQFDYKLPYLLTESECVTLAGSLNTQRYFTLLTVSQQLVTGTLRYLIYANHVLTNAQCSPKAYLL